MNIAGRKIWQQAAGDKDRNYAAICIKWGVILNGPGKFGPWPECYDDVLNNGAHKKKLTDLRRFAEEMKAGDLVALRLGTDTCIAVGEICGEYTWNPCFGDIDGWNIQHVRRVKWLWSSLENPKKFQTYSFKQGDTTQILSDGAVKSWISELYCENLPLAELPDLPENDDETTIDEIADFLFDQGVAAESISHLTGKIGELLRIANWYHRSKNPPSEPETIAYLVVPFLRALGWTPQKMAIEWNHVDVALFHQLPRDSSNLAVVVEAKKMNNSCLTAQSQASNYAEKHGCQSLIVTDGIRYGVFSKADSSFKLDAYLNLTRLRKEYPVYACNGAMQAILAMTPEEVSK